MNEATVDTICHISKRLTKCGNFQKTVAELGKSWQTSTPLMNTWPIWTILITYSFGQHDMVLILCICDPTNSFKGLEGSVSKVPTAAPTPIPTAAPTAEPTPVPIAVPTVLVLRDSHFELWGCHHERIGKFRRARSRLYRSRILQVDVSFSAFF